MARRLKPRTPFAERLIAARAGMTRAELATHLNCPLTTVAGWERGVSFPSSDNLVRLSDLLQVSLDWLIAGRGSAGDRVLAVQADPDEELLETIFENLQMLAAEEDVCLEDGRCIRLMARLYGDLMRAFTGKAERRIGLRALSAQVRRELTDGKNLL
ncbi:helix-turn-helix transcriptional regulator [Oleispirillum naphthae]|uniref:helix-turn-helix domain-containing protein n=1 Tax=Oleispirillum naphthae TaxID=2838853 RepID=UPI003082235B